MKKLFVCFITILCVIILFLTNFVNAQNEKSIIIATGQDVPKDDNLAEEYRIPEKYHDNAVQFITEDGILLCGYVLGNGSQGITLGHANGWTAASWLSFAEKLVDKGYQVIIWTYRNNEPSGSASGEAAYRLDLDVLAAVKVLRERGATEILSMGASVGGTSTAVAAPNIPELVGLGILSSPRNFGSINALEAVRKIDVPAFFAVSSKDFTGNYYDEVSALYESCSSTQKQFHVIDSPEHGTDMLSENDMFSSTDEQIQKRKELAEKLMVFVNESFGNDITDENQISVSETEKTTDQTKSSSDTVVIFPLIIGLGVLLLFIIVAVIIKKVKTNM